MSDALTALLDRVADAASKATPGPWWRHDGSLFVCADRGDGRDIYVTEGTGSVESQHAIADVLHIANCDPDLVSALVAVVRAGVGDTRCFICGKVYTSASPTPRKLVHDRDCPAGALIQLAESRARKEQP
jgi:hypothetical protein